MFSVKKWKNYMKFPLLVAPAIRNRVLSVVITLMPLIFIILNVSGIFVWKCPFHELTGLECGGCGMTRGVIALVKGHFMEAFNLHPFSILLLFFWSIWVIVTFLPEKWREEVIGRIAYVERKTGFVIILATLFIAFGIIRLIFQISRM